MICWLEKIMIRKVLLSVLLAWSWESHACSIMWSSSSAEIQHAMNVGFKERSGWNFSLYDQACDRLLRNNAKLEIIGQIWEYQEDYYIYSYVLAVGDKVSDLITTDFAHSSITKTNRISNPYDVYLEFFDSVNNSIDSWVASDSFNKAIVEFHRHKTALRGK